MMNALTFDIEDYYQVEAFKAHIAYEEWSSYPSRVVENTKKITDILDERGVKATFFILGWVAERFPDMVKHIAGNGHEIATHGYAHQMVYKQNKEEFEHDLVTSIDILEQSSGQKIIGYRAPTYSIVEESFWALDVLIKHGMLYDSSIFPIAHDRYGVPDGQRFPYVIERENGKNIVEFPLSTLRFFNTWNFPIAGGGYMRLLPYWFLKAGIRHLNKQHQPGIIYLHPWELDPDQPKIPNISRATKFRHYLNLHHTAEKLRRLICDFDFAPIRDVLHMSDLS
ncbi:polysaccharide deacetylase family protein [candidate division KSB3 bacterium]|uniref:Polysaccharide deacetylase family protein n=1 Tax=candidate division KSB3 bacterium TaxID=2044937 RepID=A0A2G6KMJ7_9BACT|nr:MAG: polysaccharide deacetylase family protein [candidate division KSB3 bacterium]